MRVIAVLGLVVALPTSAGAAARYASPSPSGSMDCASPATACDVASAIGAAGVNDDIFVPGDLGDYHVGSAVNPAAAPIHIHGTNGRPRLLFSSGSLTLKGPSTVEHLYVEGPGTTFGLHAPAGGSVDDLIVKVTDGGHACYLSGGHTLTNSVCWAANGDLAIELDGSNTFRNDTFIGGTTAAVKAFGRAGCGCTTATDTFVNVIARAAGAADDFNVESDGSADITIDVTYSNYGIAAISGTGSPSKVHIIANATDQGEAPLLVDAAAGDFHQVLGSPTIDAGVNDPANGTTDFDGDPRTVDGTTDIGADEFVPPAGVPTPTPRPSPATLGHFFGYGTKATKGEPAFVPIGPVALADRFGGRNYDVTKATTLFLPASKNGGVVQDDVTHLLAYAVKASKGDAKFVVPPDVHVLNQCSDVALVVKKPVALLVPTAKSLTSPPTPPVEADHQLDHLLCYAVKSRTKLAKGSQVDVADQFQTRRYDLKKITKLCVPVAKSGTPFVLKGPGKGSMATITPADVRHPEALLVCYQAKLASADIPQLVCAPAVPKNKGTKIVPKQLRHTRIGVFIANQLGALQLDGVKETELCIPSLAP